MPGDKFSALWVSHSSMNDFLTCPRAYYLNNMYKDPNTGHKIKLVTPAMSLGQAVHQVIESLSVLPTDVRFNENLLDKFEKVWEEVSGKKGGFSSDRHEQTYKDRGRKMIERVIRDPGILKNKAVKINMELPYFWLSEQENIILCGKVDWLEYLPETDSVHIIDFKTSLRDENPDSLQLPIYHLLVKNCQKRDATKASYWYLEREDGMVAKSLPDLEESREKVLKIARQISLSRKLSKLSCPTDGCASCRPLEAIVAGKGEFVGIDNYKQDMYTLPFEPKKDSEIL